MTAAKLVSLDLGEIHGRQPPSPRNPLGGLADTRWGQRPQTPSGSTEASASASPLLTSFTAATFVDVRVSTRGDYASRALLSLALHQDESGPTTVRDIAERTGLPQPYLEQILLALKGAGLVRSKRGVGGGYVLARRPADINLAEILRAVDGPIVLGDFGDPHTDGACDHEGQCVLLSIWHTIGNEMRQRLETFSLADIAAIAGGGQPWPSSS